MGSEILLAFLDTTANMIAPSGVKGIRIAIGKWEKAKHRYGIKC